MSDISQTALEVDPNIAAKPALTPEDVFTAVCAFYKVSHKDIMGLSRSRHIVYPRHIIMYLLRTDLMLPYEAIKIFLGKKDHSTTMHGVRCIEVELEKGDSLLKLQLLEIRRGICPRETPLSKPPLAASSQMESLPAKKPLTHIELYGQLLCTFDKVPQSHQALKSVSAMLHDYSVACGACRSRASSMTA